MANRHSIRQSRLPFKFTGSIDKLTFNLGPEQITAKDRNVADKALAVAHD